jgi:hypothetical protein
MNTKSKIIAACTAALIYGAPLAAFAASPTPAASPKSSPPAKALTSPSDKTTAATTKVRAIPFHGTISTVDQTAKTFTIAGKEKSRVFRMTDTTVITKGGAPATMNDVAANEEVRGNYVKAADGTLEAKTVKLGPLTDAEKAEKKPSKKKKASEDDASSTAAPSPSPKP